MSTKDPAFGVALRTARDAAMVTQSELAAQVGASVSSVARWERGELPRKSMMRRLRKALAGLAKVSETEVTE